MHLAGKRGNIIFMQRGRQRTWPAAKEKEECKNEGGAAWQAENLTRCIKAWQAEKPDPPKFPEEKGGFERSLKISSSAGPPIGNWPLPIMSANWPIGQHTLYSFSEFLQANP